MTGISSGGGGGYDYVETFYPSDAEEGEELYHLTENAAFVYDGAGWIEQTVTDHSQLSGVNEGDHRSDQRVSDLAPLQSVNGRTGAVTGLFEASAYTPEADTHDRYTDAEASSAAPVQDVNGQMGSVSVNPSWGPTSYDNTTSSRSLGSTYTNSTGSMLFVSVTVNSGEVTDSFNIRARVNNDPVAQQSLRFDSGQLNKYSRLTVSFIVPPGDNYEVEQSSGLSNPSSYWDELEMPIQA